MKLEIGGTTARSRKKSQDQAIWFHELFNLNLKFKKIKRKYEKEKYEIKAHVFEIDLNITKPWEYPAMSTSWWCNLRIHRNRYVGSGR